MTDLKAQPRTESGKEVNALRRAGFLPAVVYGEGLSTQSITVAYKDFEKAYKAAGESTLLSLDVAGKTHNVLIHDVQFDPVKDKPLHADFYAVRMDKMIRTKVPVAFIGEAPAVKSEGGILVKVMHELEIEALPKDLPHGLEIHLDGLASIGAKLLVKDIVLPNGVKLITQPDDIIILVEAPRSEEELAKLAEAPEVVDPTKVKTEQEIKKEAKEKEQETAE